MGSGQIVRAHYHRGAEVSKLRRQRHVTITDTAAVWLSRIVKKTGPIVTPENFRKRFDSWRTAAGIKHWPNNALRHTFAASTFRRSRMKSARLTKWVTPRQSAPELQGTLTDASAAKYWGLRPEADAKRKIVP